MPMRSWEALAGAGGRRDYTVSELGADVDAFVGEAFRDLWVVGSVARLRRHSNGHWYFELTEKGPRDQVIGRLDAVVWARDRWRVEAALGQSRVELADGIEARCRIQLGYWAPGGRLQASVREIDPLFSLGMIERRRRQVRDELARSGLLGANRALDLALLPLDVGLVASRDSAAYHDVMASLGASGRPFRIRHADARVQGAAAERELVRALELLVRHGGLDAIAIVRGGGARADLAAFDALAVARAVAACPVPVLTGLGHETDSTICDEVAWRACHTPTRVAEVLVGAVEEADRSITGAARRIGSAGDRALQRERGRLERARLRLFPAARRLDRLEARLAHQRERLALAGQRGISGAGAELGRRAAGLARSTRQILAAQSAQLEQRRQLLPAAGRRGLEGAQRRLAALARLTRELGPQRWLERGFAIARTQDGLVVRDAGKVGLGELITTELAHGKLVSRVEEVLG
jgi:exodeoxyribonuclease VII large subunit